MRLVETHVFTSLVRGSLDDDEYRALQKNEQGDLTKAQVQLLGRLVREEFG